MVTHRRSTPDLGFLRGRRILLTGHTGFKGAWLAEWLLGLGATVHGIALAPESADSLFERLDLASRLVHVECDIRDMGALRVAVQRAQPEIVFHLAAQALVRRSYREPLQTWSTNVLGTLNLLEALRELGRPVRVVAVTTDKVYRNREWAYAYREVDELGGQDPYSASKAACELAVRSWRESIGAASGVRVATARAGNVLGPGDDAEDRIVPDCYRAWRRGEPVAIRQPGSTRPWQHVLEPLSGYLALAEHLDRDGSAPVDALNFGPGPGGNRTVRELVSALAAFAPGRGWVEVSEVGGVHEARSLSLTIDRAEQLLGWSPGLDFADTMAWVDAGYRAESAALAGIVRDQIRSYQSGWPA
jgi:CDP-glucose 4,6-dehydratase